ncbi:MAG: CCA tRNA nucleotidyltransferase [Deltaproteobacteria bacterium]|nr:MAG: CCA tRNA nucleotidyltransferase [Deltaproteobacteria bacterium]
MGIVIGSKNNPLIQKIITTLHQNGYKAYIAGGAVRDMLLNQVPDDVDILTNASTRTVAALFANTRQVGKSFPICLVDGVEVASCRAGDAIDFPADDLGMRDFTINSMAWDSVSKTLVDPFSGKRDLADKIIRFTRDPGERIFEDPLRMIRACRFVARLVGVLSDASLAAILTHASLIDPANGKVTGERIQMELIKAMGLTKPSLFFRSLHETGLLAWILPCLDRCFDLDGGPHHGETVFEHCLLVGDALPANRPLLRLAGFLHDAGKFDAVRIKEGKLTFAGHEKFFDAIQTDLERLRFSSRHKTYILSLVQAHMRPLTEETTPKATRRLLAMLDSHHLSFRDFLRMRIADKKGNLAKSPYTLAQIRVRLKKIQDELSGRTAFNLNDLDISGNDIIEALDLEPGPEIGRIKELLFERVLEDPSLNTRANLESLLKGISLQTIGQRRYKKGFNQRI